MEIDKTLDYITFKNRAISMYYGWLARDMEGRPYSTTNMWSGQAYEHALLLYGEAGSGKTAYFEILQNEFRKKSIPFEKINSIEQILLSETVYFWDAVNETSDFDVNELIAICKKKKIYIIFSGWDKEALPTTHEITPSDSTLNDTKWPIIADEFKGINFSIREKTLMGGMSNINSHKPHQLLWKAFESIFSEHPFPKKIMKVYKELAYKDPEHIAFEILSHDDYVWLLKKHIIQNGKHGLTFSHKVIALNLHLRKWTKEIKNLSMTKRLQSFFMNETGNLIWWHQVLSGDDIALYKYIVKFQLKMRVSNIELFRGWDGYFNLSDLNLNKLSFSEMNWLDQNGNTQLLFEQYLNENILANNEEREFDNQYGEVPILILTVMADEQYDAEHTMRINSMKANGNWRKIKVCPESQREKMLVFCFFRYVAFYFDATVSALSYAKLNESIFAENDIGNSFDFFNWVSDIYKKFQGYGSAISSLDSLLNQGKGRSKILEGSSKYRRIDDRFVTGRNALGSRVQDIGHQYVNYSMYITFEMESNPFESEVGSAAKLADKFGNQYPNKYDISNPFLHFLDLLINENDLYDVNALPQTKTLDTSITFPNLEIFGNLMQNNIVEFALEIKKFLLAEKKLGKNIVKLKLKAPKNIAKKGVGLAWVLPSFKYSLYDPELSKEDLVYSEQEPYKFSGLYFNENSYSRIFHDPADKYSEYILDYNFDDINDNFRIKQGALLFNLDDDEIHFIDYKTTLDSTETDAEIDDFYRNAYNEKPLPILRNLFLNGQPDKFDDDEIVERQKNKHPNQWW